MSTVRIQIRRGTATEWTNADTALNSTGGLILAAGEMGVETNTRKIKIGDGTTRWGSLQYIAADSPAISEIAQDAINEALSMGSGLTKSYSDSTNTISLGIDTDVVATKTYVDNTVGGLQNTVESDYVLIADVGNAGGPAKLDSNGNLLVPKASIILEGQTANDFETKLTVTDPTQDRTITFPDASGTIAFTSDVATAKSEANSYTDNAISGLVDGAPGALNTLNELAAALGDDESYAATITNQLSDISDIVSDISAAGLFHTQSGTNVHGIANTADLATKVYADNSSQEAVGVHNTAVTNVHGISNTADLMLKTGSTMTGTLVLSGNPENDLEASTKQYVDNQIGNTEIYADDAADAAVSVHTALTQNVHGIADTTALATMSYVDTAEADAITAAGTEADSKIATAVAALTKSSVGLGNIDNTSDADKPVSTATQTALDLKAPIANPTFTGTVILPSTTSIGNVSESDISQLANLTAPIQEQFDSKADLAGANFTGNVEVDGNLVVDGDFTVNGTNFSASATSITIEDNLVQLAHQNSANTVDLGLVVAYNDGSAKHAGVVRDVSEAKWKLFKGVSTEPSTVVAFNEGSLDDLQVAGFEATSATIGDVSNTELQYLNGVTSAIQTQIDTKAPVNDPVFTGTVTVSQSSGIVFSDGTQTKVGVPSITTFGTERAQSETLASGEQDKFIPLNGAVQITLPSSGYSTGQSIDFYQASGTGASFASTNSVVGTPGLKFRTTNSVVTAMKTPNGWLVFGDLLA